MSQTFDNEPTMKKFVAARVAENPDFGESVGLPQVAVGKPSQRPKIEWKVKSQLKPRANLVEDDNWSTNMSVTTRSGSRFHFQAGNNGDFSLDGNPPERFRGLSDMALKRKYG